MDSAVIILQLDQFVFRYMVNFFVFLKHPASAGCFLVLILGKIAIPTLLCGANLIFHAIIFLSYSKESSLGKEGGRMSERKKSVVRLFAAAALLFAVSAYRQLSMRYWPEDFLRPYLVWVVYMLLLFGWQYTITTKIM